MSESASVKSSIAALPGRIRTALDFRYGALVWFGILGTTITFLAGLEGMVALNERVRRAISAWREFMHAIWTTVFGWIGIEIPPSLFALLNFAVFAFVLAVGVRIRAQHFSSNLTPDQRRGIDVKAWRIVAGFVALIALPLLSLLAVALLQRRGLTVSLNWILLVWIAWSLVVMFISFLWTHRFDKLALQLFPLALIYSGAVFVVPFLKSITNSYLDMALVVSSLAAINLIFSVMMRIAPPVALRKRLSAAIGLALLIALPVLIPTTVAQFHTMQGTSLIGAGKRPEGLTKYKKSLEIYEFLARSDPSSTLRQSYLALAYSNFGDAVLPDGNNSEATGYYQKAADIGEKLIVAEPKNAIYQRNLSIFYRQLGDMRVAEGAHDKAIALYRRSLAMAESIFAANSINMDSQIDIGVYNSKLGDALFASGDQAGAMQPLKAAVEIGERLSHADPANTLHSRNLGIYYRQLADALYWSGSKVDAMSRYRDAMRIGEHALAQNKSDAMLLGDLDLYVNRLANGYYDAGDYAEAATLYQKSIDLREALAQAEPQNAIRQSQAIEAVSNLGITLAVKGDRDQALPQFRRALALSERVVERASQQPAGDAAGRIKADALNRLAWNALQAAEFGKALAASESAIALQPDFALPKLNRAYALLYLGRRDEARAIYATEAEEPVPQVGNRPWREIFWEGLGTLRRIGRDDPSFDDLPKLFEVKN